MCGPEVTLAPHVNPTSPVWNLTYYPSHGLSARGRRLFLRPARLLRPAPGPPSQSVLDTWARELTWARRPAAAGHGRGRGGPLRLNKTKASHHSEEAQGFTLAHAALPVLLHHHHHHQAPHQRRPPPRPCSPRLGISSALSGISNGGGGAERSGTSARPRHLRKGGRRRHWQREGRHWIDRSFWNLPDPDPGPALPTAGGPEFGSEVATL